MAVSGTASIPDLTLDISGLPDVEALEQVGTLINASQDAFSAEGTNHAFVLLKELEKRTLAPNIAPLVHYFRANAWDNRMRLAPTAGNIWAWEQAERQEQILELRRAMKHESFDKLHAMHRCQILTNLANSFSNIGRFIEALELWDRALGLNAKFGMARGNRGAALSSYAKGLYDHGHARLMLVFAHDALRAARARDALYEDEYPSARAFFRSEEEDIAAHIPVAKIRRRLRLHDHAPGLGRGAQEKRYRSWCLRNRLFVNPLNDLGSLPIAAQDVMTLPPVIRSAGVSNVPAIIGFFNQIKQEYVSARYLCYEGVHTARVHFSDRDVLLYNTLNYPAYSLAAEKVRAAFRLAYSLFDKIGFFLNDDLDLGINATQVSFRTLWHEPQKGKDPKSRVLRQRFINYENWPLRGLFWLSKDLFDEKFRSCTEPDATDLHNIRNHLEHKYLQLHLEWGSSIAASPATGGIGYGLSFQDFQEKTIRVLKLVRAAIMYLSLAVHREERLREAAKPKGKAVTIPISLGTWDDDWKRPDL